jgi:hypothetical protein
VCAVVAGDGRRLSWIDVLRIWHCPRSFVAASGMVEIP